MRSIRLLLLAAATAGLGGCYVVGPERPAYAPVAGPAYRARPYAPGACEPGHYGPNGYYVPAHCR